jgi:hypothetical protein
MNTKKITPVIGDTDEALKKDLGYLQPSYQDPALGDWEAALENLRDDPEIGDLDEQE